MSGGNGQEGASGRNGPQGSPAGSADPSQPINVLVVTNMYPSPENPSLGTFVQAQVDALRRLGLRVDVLPILGPGRKLKYLLGGASVVRATRRSSYDVVHAHYGLSGIPALFRRRAPLVVTLHGSDALVGRIQPTLSRIVCRFASEVIAVSAPIAERIAAEVIPCGVDLDRFRPRDRAEARRKLGLVPDAAYILFPFSPRRPVKRFDLASATVEALRSRGRNASILVPPGVGNEEMPWYYAAADAMILCSDSEGSPTSVKESLACNVPVAAVSVGDVPDVLRDVDGCAVCPRDAGALASALDRILSRQAGCPFEGRSAAARYDGREIARRVERVYRRAMNRSAR